MEKEESSMEDKFRGCDEETRDVIRCNIKSNFLVSGLDM
jgi:hypothetical protein